MAELSGITTIIWDLDGALVDTMPDIVNSLRAAARSVGYGELTDEQTKNKVGGGARGAFTALFGETDKQFIEPAIEHFKVHYPQHCADNSKLYPGVVEVLDNFHGHMHLALATAKIRSATLQLLRSLGVLDYFEYVVTADDLQRMKPDPQSIQIILDKLGVSDPLEAVMVGDMATDIQAGKAAGVRTVGVTYGYGRRTDLVAARPDALIDSALELTKLVRVDRTSATEL